MHLRRISITNIRGFSNVDLELLGAGWAVVAGRNGAGKTTFLRALALGAAGPATARTLVETFRGWVRTGESSASVATRIAVDEKDTLQGSGGQAGAYSAKLTWSAAAESAEPVLGADARSSSKPAGPWRGSWHDNPRGWFIAGYGPFRRLSGHATGAERLMVTSNHVSRLVSLFREDASLAECVQWLRTVYTQKLESRPGAEALEATIIALLNDGLLPDGTRVTRVDSDGPWINQGAAELPLRELSDGYRVVVALVLDLVWQLHQCFGDLHADDRKGVVRIRVPGIVLIDEVDAHLHVSWQQRIGPWFKAHFPNVQFIVTTHSPFICQAADELIRLPAPGESGRADHVSDEVFKRVVNGTADDAVLTDLFGLERTWSEEAERRRRRLDVLRITELRGDATLKETREANTLARNLPVTPSTEVAIALADVRELLRSRKDGK